MDIPSAEHTECFPYIEQEDLRHYQAYIDFGMDSRFDWIKAPYQPMEFIMAALAVTSFVIACYGGFPKEILPYLGFQAISFLPLATKFFSKKWFDWILARHPSHETFFHVTERLQDEARERIRILRAEWFRVESSWIDGYGNLHLKIAVRGKFYGRVVTWGADKKDPLPKFIRFHLSTYVITRDHFTLQFLGCWYSDEEVPPHDPDDHDGSNDGESEYSAGSGRRSSKCGSLQPLPA